MKNPTPQPIARPGNLTPRSLTWLSALSTLILSFAFAFLTACSPPVEPVGENSFTITDQVSDGSSMVIQSADVKKDVWVLAYKDGSSAVQYGRVLLKAGKHDNVKITFDKKPSALPAKVDVHFRNDNGDGKFDINEDKPINGEDGNPQIKKITLSADARGYGTLSVSDQGSDGTSFVIEKLDFTAPTMVLVFKRSSLATPILTKVFQKGAQDKVKMTFEMPFKSLPQKLTIRLAKDDGDGKYNRLKDELIKENNKAVQFDFAISEPITGATLAVADQTLTGTYDTFVVQEAALPQAYTSEGVIAVFEDGGGKPGNQITQIKIAPNKTHKDIEIKFTTPIQGAATLYVKLQTSTGMAFLDSANQPLEFSVQVIGDQTEPNIVIKDQEFDPKDLKTVKIEQITVPPFYKRGLWLTVYADDKGKITGSVLQKKHFEAGDHKTQTIVFIQDFKEKQTLRAIFREPTASGGFSSKGKIVPLPGVGEDGVVFGVDSDAFYATLEVEDQTLTNNSTITIKRVVIPQSHFYARVALYADDNGKRGALLGQKQFSKGETMDKTIDVSPAQAGSKTIHAVIHEGQVWNPKSPIMKDRDGNEVSISFKIGARELNYISSPPYITTNPRHVIVQRAVSNKEYAWIVLARDDNGKPGMILAKKRVLPRFAGLVIFRRYTGDWEEKGTNAEYLTGNGYRRAVRGEENLHVLMYEDNPKDNKFTYKPGGTEDQPVMESTGKPVVSRIKVTVKSSIHNSQKNSQTYYLPCNLSQFYNNPTRLNTDCRCHRNLLGLDFPQCVPSIADFLKLQYGKGPRLKHLSFGAFHSGFPEKASNELMTVISFKDFKNVHPENQISVSAGAVMAVHMDTGDRRLLSGRYYDPVKGVIDIGKGPMIVYPFDMKKGPDGMYYIAGKNYVRIDATLYPTIDIIRMDPKTGDRTMVWRSNHLGLNRDNKPNPYGHCSHGRTAKYGYPSVQIYPKGFGMDPKGNFYFSYAHNGYNDTSDGIGIVKVTFDGKNCSFVTRTKVGANNALYKGKEIGSGPKPQAGPYHGLLYKDGYIYAQIVVGKQTYKIEEKTGNRQVIYTHGVDGNVTGNSGAKMLWDHHRNLIWVQGLVAQTMLIDPANNRFENLWCSSYYRNFKGINCQHSGAWGTVGPPMERGFWIHPTDPEFAYVSANSKIIKIHLPSGTQVIHSY